MRTYVILTELTIEALQTSVIASMEAGWTPLGGPFQAYDTITPQFHQAMVK